MDRPGSQERTNGRHRRFDAFMRVVLQPEERG